MSNLTRKDIHQCECGSFFFKEDTSKVIIHNLGHYTLKSTGMSHFGNNIPMFLKCRYCGKPVEWEMQRPNPPVRNAKFTIKFRKAILCRK